MNYDREIERYRKEREKTSISINACVRLIAQKDSKLGAKLRKLISKYIGSPSKKRASIMSKINKLISKVKMKSNFIVDSSTVKNIIDSYSNLDSTDKNRLAHNIDNPLDEIVNFLNDKAIDVDGVLMAYLILLILKQYYQFLLQNIQYHIFYLIYYIYSYQILNKQLISLF